MGMAVEFRILGDLEVWSESTRVPVGGVRERRVLAMLLLEAGRPVPVGRLVDAVWDDDPPETAVKQVRNAVSRLRVPLGAETIAGTAAGYRIALPDGALDARVFEARVARAAGLAASEELADAVEELGAALALWRGAALAGVGGAVIDAAASVWNERRLAARETFFEYELARGRHAEAVAGLMALAGEEPFREKPVGDLMLALHRCGRQSDALALFTAFRVRMADELGLDPSTELRNLHRRILNDDPDLAAPPRPDTSAAVPRQLPAAVPHFAGRAAELKTLDGLLDDAAQGGTVIISAIGGTAGIGKTALAVHWAHHAAGRFPDGQMYVNLRGFDPSGAPVVPAAAIRGFLDALGVDPRRIPTGLDAQAALYRSLVAGKRMLVLLDNARDVAQVRPLLPGSPACVVVVTSRDQLTGLVVAEGAQPIALDLPTEAEAHELLLRRLGPKRLAEDPRAVAGLIHLCARLPLALNIVAARAATVPALSLAASAAALRDARTKLAALGTGDTLTDARSVFSWSYQALAAPAARMFRLLGLHPGPDVSLPAAASLAGVPVADARRALAELTRAHLLIEQEPGRFGFHDLLRAYAAERVHELEAADDRAGTLHRLLDHYLYTAYAANRVLEPSRAPIELPALRPGVTPEAIADEQAATAWCEAERLVLLAAARRAHEAGSHVHAWQIPWCLATFLLWRGHWDDYVASHLTALAATERLDDPYAQARIRRGLGLAHLSAGAVGEADTHLTSALDLYRRLGDRAGQAHVYFNLAQLSEQSADYDRAVEHAELCGELFRSLDQPTGQAQALNALGWYLVLQGNQSSAIDRCRQAVAIFHDLRDRHGEAGTWDTLGYAHYHLGEFEAAIGCYERTLDLLQETGAWSNAADTLDHLGDARLAMGDPGAAREAWTRALAILDGLNRPDAERVRAKIVGAPSTPTRYDADTALRGE
jgi:DNA-binding SARP family transcriptional activator/tetratricopeptide (TPR) repeat protein